jgi:hypothetical protein
VTCTQYAYGTTMDGVADQIESWTRSGQTTWLYCHNLAFDASTTDLPNELIRRGWQITSSHIIDSPIWFRFRRGRSRLVLTDSHGVWPCSLATIAADLGMAKTPLPDPRDDDITGWWERCETDVTILATALLQALDYWDANQLGKWSVTGSGSGWSVYKTNFITEDILIDIDDSAMTFEQTATYGGRREAFRLGEWKRGQFVDMDFRAAYPSIAAKHDLPVRRLREFDHMDSVDYRDRKRNRGVIAECDVITTQPVAPVRYGESIFYPVGRYRTVLASPEIDLLLATGAHVSIGHGYEYRLGPAMALWGTWITDLITADRPDVPPVVRRQAKHWSRAVIGRWTMRLSRKVPLPGFPTTGQLVTRAEWLDYDPADLVLVDGQQRRRPGAVPARRTKGYQIMFGGEYYALRQDVWPENGFPAIWAFVESWCRVHLWHAMAAQPPGDVWQCDTDGFLLGRTARTNTRRRVADDDQAMSPGPLQLDPSHPMEGPTLAGPQLVEKGRYSSARILGPQHTVLGGQRRFPGVPRTAVEVGPDTFHAETWPGFIHQVENGRPGTFRTGTRTLKVGAGLNPRWTLVSGRTLPVEMAPDQHGRNAIVPPPAWSAGNRVVLADDQHAVLSRVRHS